MLAMTLRVRPCSDREKRSSLLRCTSTRRLPSFSTNATLTSGWKANSRPLGALGPSTTILPSAIFTLTFAGTSTGCLPIRDMVHFLDHRLPHGAEHFAAQLLGAGAAVAHDAAACAENTDAEAVQHRPQLRVAQVEPPTRTARAFDVPDDALALRPVFQEHAQRQLRLGQVGRLLELIDAVLVLGDGADLKIVDETFVLEHLGDVDLEARRGHIDRGALDAVGVANAGQHVG